MKPNTPQPSKPYIMTIRIPPLPPQIVHTPECEHGLPTLVCPKCGPSTEDIENAPVEDEA